MNINICSPQLVHVSRYLCKPCVFWSSSFQTKYISCSAIAHNSNEDKPKKKVYFQNTRKQFKLIPTPALFYMASGLIPFIYVPLEMAMLGAYDEGLHANQLVYGAVVLSFIGGSRWGRTLSPNSDERPDYRNLTYSIIPPMLAWGAQLMPLVAGTVTLIMGLGVFSYTDASWIGYPTWFKIIRLWASLFAVVALTLSIIIRVVLPDKDMKKILQKVLKDIKEYKD